MARVDFVRVAYPEPHVERTRQILQAHPEIRGLFGTEPRSALWGLGLVALQLGLAWVSRGAPAWVWLAAAWLVGATLNHALWVLIHECTHRLVFRRGWANRALAIVLNLPHGVPSAMAFTKYHMLHHVRQGDPELDADLPGPVEAGVLSGSVLRKGAMIVLFSFLQGAVRPARLRKVPLLDGWVTLNIVVQLIFLGWFWTLAGPWAVGFLFLSTFLGLGPHPLGGRWISEHYLVHEHQETNSYYGGLNRVSFNVGYHTEHHDFMRVPWNRLPEVTELAPEFYRDRFAYRSWWHALRRFVGDPAASPFDRVVRSPEER